MHNTQRRISRYHRKILHILWNYKRFSDKWWQYSFTKQNIRRSSTPWLLKDGTAVSMLLATDSKLVLFELSYVCYARPLWPAWVTSVNHLLKNGITFRRATTKYCSIQKILILLQHTITGTTLRITIYCDAQTTEYHLAPSNYIKTTPIQYITYIYLILKFVFVQEATCIKNETCIIVKTEISEKQVYNFQVFYQVLAWWWPFRVEICCCKITTNTDVLTVYTY